MGRTDHHAWDGSAWVNKGIYLESEARTNLITHSQDFTDASWSKFQFSSAVDAVSPTGGVDATTLTAGNSGTVGVTELSSQFTLVASQTYTVSIFAKAGTARWIAFGGFQFTSPADGRVWFDLQNGVVGTQNTGWVGSIENVGSGWYETLQIDAANMPDYQTPNVIGPELVTNGTFDTDTSGWTLSGANSSQSAVGGRLRVTSVSPDGNARSSQGFTTEVGKTYLATANGFQGTTSGGIQVQFKLGTSSGGSEIRTLYFSDAPGGEFSHVFVATTTTTYVTVQTNVPDAYTEWDNISVREIDPLAVSIYMRGEVSYADNDSGYLDGGADGAEVIQYRWYASTFNCLGAGINTGGSRTGQQLISQEITNVFVAVSASTNYYTPAQNVPFAIAGRHGSNFINGAVDGTALTENTTPTGLADLSAIDFQIGVVFNGTISAIRVFAGDIGDSGTAEVTS